MRIVIKPLGAAVLLILGITIGTVALQNLREKRVAGRAVTTFNLVGDSGKRSWLQNRLYRYNVAHTGAKPIPVLMRDTRIADRAYEGDLNSIEPPHLWAFSGNGWAATGSGENAPRTLFVTPLVLVTTKEKAAALRPYLVGTAARSTFTALESLVQGKLMRRAEPAGLISWRAVVNELGFPYPAPKIVPVFPRPLTFMHADPTMTADGLYVRGLLLADYAARTKTTAAKAVSDPAFAAFMRRLYQGFQPADPALSGEPTALARAYARDPSRADVLICAENDALLAIRENSRLVVLMPGPTTLLPQSVVAVRTERLAPAARQKAEEVLESLSSDEAVADALRAGFRPVDGGRSPGLTRYAARGFVPVIKTARPLPSLSLMKKAADL